MPDHRTPIFSGRGRSRGYRGRHSAGAALELDGTELAERAPEPEPAEVVEPVPDHVQGVPVGDSERVSLELHFAGMAGNEGDRSDGIWRVK